MSDLYVAPKSGLTHYSGNGDYTFCGRRIDGKWRVVNVATGQICPQCDDVAEEGDDDDQEAATEVAEGDRQKQLGRVRGAIPDGAAARRCQLHRLPG